MAIGDIKQRTEYFILNLGQPNQPGTQSYGTLLRNTYYEIVSSENLRGSYICNTAYIDNPIKELGTKFDSSLENNIKRAAATISTAQPNRIFDMSRSISMAVGQGAPAQRLQYDLVGKTFYVPGSAYDIRRKFENVATPEKLEQAYRKVGSVDEYGDPITSEAVGTVDSTALYSQNSTSPIVRELVSKGANELPDNQMGMGEGLSLLRNRGGRDDNRTTAARVRETVRNELDQQQDTTGSPYPSPGSGGGYFLRNNTIRRRRRANRNNGDGVPTRLRFEQGGTDVDVEDGETLVPTDTTDDDTISQEFRVIDQEDSKKLCYEMFPKYAYHYMIDKEDIKSDCTTPYVTLDSHFELKSDFALQCALEN